MIKEDNLCKRARRRHARRRRRPPWCLEEARGSIRSPSDTEVSGGGEGREWEGAGQARLCFRGGRGAEHGAGFVSWRQESQGLVRTARRRRAGGLAEPLSQAGCTEATKEESSQREKSVSGFVLQEGTGYSDTHETPHLPTQQTGGMNSGKSIEGSQGSPLWRGSSPPPQVGLSSHPVCLGRSGNPSKKVQTL